MTQRILAARLDSAGDVLLTGPAVRALAQAAESLVFLVGPRGRVAAQLLPGVDEVVEYHAPWVDFEPNELTADSVAALVKQIRDYHIDKAFVFTSFHQSPLPLALILRMAAVPWIGAISVDYPGSLLDLRYHVDGDPPEPERALSLCRAAGIVLSATDSGALQVRRPLPDVTNLTGEAGYVVVHPGAAVPARRMTADRARRMVAAIAHAGHRVIVTGSPSEAELTAVVAGDAAQDLGGATSFAELAAVLERAAVVIAPNTGPAHLAAAVGTPVVSLFAPVVPASRWAPYGVPIVLLGAQHAKCAGSRARTCPIPGHPCLDGIADSEVLAAIAELTERR
ncbi:glycosyltransferase family 9 protein [Skermania sp. ID1734]|uniref:glycosyltransferase family 9 protein n=1 Tax=Skermania sp. ID1734 TaxID=2597516 RepID=UPI00117D21D5|nr:glycosyltransferase family 9 protein [Skermania sp. ID1734]TSD99458.1 glycosyltransferase family 9 protein [Skermania sp. ID1734]